MSRKLIVNDGRRERELLLVGSMVVGRDPTCDISDADPLLSRRHVEFLVRGKEVIVRDLGSRNGILINGVKIAQSVLRGGDVVQVAHLQVRFVEDNVPLVAAPETSPDNEETARAPRRPPLSTAPKPARVESPTIGAQSTRMDEPTERVMRPPSIASTNTLAGALDKTLPTLGQAFPQAAPNPKTPGVSEEPESTQFATPPIGPPLFADPVVPPPSLEACVVLSPQYTITEACRGCVDLVGAPLDALVGQRLVDAIPDREIAGEVLRCLGTLFTKGEQTGAIDAATGPYRVSIVLSRQGKDKPLMIVLRQDR